jgi:hypothetical protein
MCVILVCLPVRNELFQFHNGFDFDWRPWVAAPVNLFRNGVADYAVINTVPVVALYFLRLVVTYTFYYAVFVTAAMLVGNAGMYLIVSAILNGLLIGIWGLINLAAYYYIFGFRVIEETFMRLMIYTHPLTISAIMGSWSSQNILVPYLVYTAIIIGLLTLSYWLYRLRKLERAGDSVVFMPVRQGLLFLTSVGGMLAMGLLLAGLTIQRPVTMYIGFVIGFVLAYLIAQMVFEQSFKVFHKMKPILAHGGAVVAVIALFNLANALDITGHITFTPNANDVRAVYLDSPWLMEREQNGLMRQAMTITDRNIINRTVRAHEVVISERASLRRTFLVGLFMDMNERWDGRTRQYIHYEMNDGRVIKRSYIINGTVMEKSGFAALMEDEAVAMARVYWLQFPELMSEVVLTRNNGSFWNSETHNWEMNRDHFMVTIMNRMHIEELFIAMRSDYITHITRHYAMLSEQNDDTYWSHYGTFMHNPSFNITARVVDNEFRTSWYYMWLPEPDSVMDWLERRGYLPDEVKIR